MPYPIIDFSGFNGRNERLEGVIRYSAYVPMFYRSNLLTHTKRLLWMLEDIIPTIQEQASDFNVPLARTMVLVHDDHEMDSTLGDVQFGFKLRMNAKEKSELKIAEERARRTVASWFPETINGFRYLDVMEQYEHQDGTQLEPAVAKWLDKFDAFGEALHELYAGNASFATAAKGMATDPVRSYLAVFRNFAREYPIMEKILENKKHPLCIVPLDIDPDTIWRGRMLHTSENIFQDKGYLPYDTWRNSIISRDGVAILVTKKE